MRALSPILLILTAPLMAGGATAATGGWHPGEFTSLPTQILPASPSEPDTVTFTAGFGPFFGTFTNSCVAENWLGSPVISVHTAAREFIVAFTPKPDPPYFCPADYAPVNGIEGELGKLDPGSWSLVITNVNWPPMDVTLSFSVAPVPRASAELIIHTRANDRTTGSTFPFDARHFVARPLGQRCNPENGGVNCGATTLQQGAPLRGSATVSLNSGLSPPGFPIPRSAIAANATGSLPPHSPYVYISTLASNARNGGGFFGPGFGPGVRTFTFTRGGGSAARMAISPGAKQFGGTMRLLGAVGGKRAHEYQYQTFVGTNLYSFEALGRECTITCYVTGAQSNFRTQHYQSSLGTTTAALVTTLAFPWTTGVVSVTAAADPFPTSLRRSGYDNRTAYGRGTIQLVAPQVVRWGFPGRNASWERFTGAIGIVRIKFVPEPSGWMTMIAGVALLSLGYRRRRSGL